MDLADYTWSCPARRTNTKKYTGSVATPVVKCYFCLLHVS